MAEVYALDLDEELLSHLAIPESLDELRAERISTNLIEDDFVAEVFEWQMAHRREHKQPATPSVLEEEFDFSLEEPLTAIGDLIERLRSRYMKLHGRKHMEKVAEAYKEDPYKLIEVLPRVTRELLDLVGKKGDTFGTGDFDRAMHLYDQDVLRGPGPSFGFKELDTHFHGMKGVTFGLAPPKTYKSWVYGCNPVVENVMAGKHMWLYSLELPAEETDMRIRCLAANVPYWKYLRGGISTADRKALEEASEALDSLGSYKVVSPEPGHRTFEEMMDRAGDAGADGVIIDQLQYVETIKGKQLGEADPREFWQPLNYARHISKSLPMIVVHQFNRSVMNADKMPDMQQAKGAAAIEEVGTLLLGLWANKDMRRSNLVELGTLASRNYQFEAWEIGVDLSRGCNFECLGRAVHDDEED